jgi:hypothetical protein
VVERGVAELVADDEPQLGRGERLEQAARQGQHGRAADLAVAARVELVLRGHVDLDGGLVAEQRLAGGDGVGDLRRHRAGQPQGRAEQAAAVAVALAAAGLAELGEGLADAEVLGQLGAELLLATDLKVHGVDAHETYLRCLTEQCTRASPRVQAYGPTMRGRT